jgi:HAD superfamily hydrolase (TIGR01450 family)
MPSSELLEADRVCRRYEEIRGRLPAARFPSETRQVESLGDLVDEFDVFVLDGYGVLNVGTEPVPGGVERIRALRAAGKRLCVLTNGATMTSAQAVGRYARLGYDFGPEEIVSSRDALARAMAGHEGMRWGVAAMPDADLSDLGPKCRLLGDSEADYEAADGFVLLSSGDWSRDRHERMIAALVGHPRPVMCGNPDLIAPVTEGLAAQPGLYAHEIADRTGVLPQFFGKPFGNAFALVAERIGPGVDPRRIAMVGDTPWTDILGGAAMGWRTVLVRDHGLVQGMTEAGIDALSDIRPDFIARTT